MEDALVLLAVFACFYPVYLVVEKIRKSQEKEIKKNIRGRK